MNKIAWLVPLLASFAIAQTEVKPDEDRVWRTFLEWMKSPAAPDNPAAVMQAYAARLAASGATETQTKEHLGILAKYAARPGSEFIPTMFDKVYTSPTPAFRSEPSAFLVRAVAGLKPGRALDVAMGQGRNGLYLAKQGWDVTGYDVSPQGLAAAARSAKEAGVKLNTILQTHDDFPFGVEQWDLIAIIYGNVSMSDTRFLDRVRAALKPGGVVVVEQFNSAPGPDSKGPANALYDTFHTFRVVRYEDVSDMADWGKMQARIGRIAAVKE